MDTSCLFLFRSIIRDFPRIFANNTWFEECVNDLYETGITDSNLATIYEAKSKNQVIVKIPFELKELCYKVKCVVHWNVVFL